MQRMGMVINIRPEKITEYKQLHSAVWPEVLAQIKRSNICKYSIFLREPENLLFGYMEYRGKDFEADMALMAENEKTQAWWKLTDPCQKPMSSAKDNENWSEMTEVFYMEQNDEQQ